jgi:Uma2 family endonuclease
MTTQVYLTPKDQGRALTLEEFEHADGQEGYHYELIDGKLEVSPLPEMMHDDLQDWLRDKLKDYARHHPEIINLVKGPARVFVPGRQATTCIYKCPPSANTGSSIRDMMPSNRR